MISRPSCNELIEAVRRELRTTVDAAVTDAAVHGALAMIDSILQNVSVRCDHELAWMRLEIVEIEGMAEHLLQSSDSSDDTIRDGLAELRNAKGRSTDASGLRREYQTASALLSQCAEVSVPLGGTARAGLDQVLQQRLAHELMIRGEFRMAGRA
jgi:hypothetical protein